MFIARGRRLCQNQAYVRACAAINQASKRCGPSVVRRQPRPRSSIWTHKPDWESESAQISEGPSAYNTARQPVRHCLLLSSSTCPFSHEGPSVFNTIAALEGKLVSQPASPCEKARRASKSGDLHNSREPERRPRERQTIDHGVCSASIWCPQGSIVALRYTS